jgi:hypothetical protein
MFVALCLVAVVSARTSAELKYTMHMELKKSETPPAQPVNPILSMFGDAVMKQIVPDGAADILYLVGEKGTRVEYMQAAMGQPAGSVNLARPDGTLIVMNPTEKTYWKTTKQSSTAAMQAAGISAPDVSVKRTGQFETIAGAKCEVITFDWKMKIPVPEAARASLPPDFPTAMEMNGDSCATTDQYQKYGEMVAKSMSAMMTAMGFDKMTQGGLVLRQKMQMMGFEMRSAVTQIAEETVPETAFEIPADYKEVPMPTGRR